MFCIFMCAMFLFYRSLIIGIIISADYKISLWGLDEVCRLKCNFSLLLWISVFGFFLLCNSFILLHVKPFSQAASVLIVEHTVYFCAVTVTSIFTPPPVGGWVIVFAQFLSLFVSLSATLRENGKWLDRFAWNFQGRCGVTMGWPDSILGQFG